MKRALKLDIEYVDVERVTGDEERIFCMKFDSTGAPWGVIGKDDKIFKKHKGKFHNDSEDRIYIIGNTEFDVDDVGQSFNIFIFDGKFTGEEKSDGYMSYKIFEVKEWNLLYPLNLKKMHIFHSDNGLTPLDYVFAKLDRYYKSKRH
jgi:hypothetical protein